MLIVLSDVPEAFNSMKQVAVAIVLIFSFSYSWESFLAMNFIKSDIRNSSSYKILSRYETVIICHSLQQQKLHLFY